MNQDCVQPTFRQNFESYLQRFDELVDEPWNTKCELHKLISGHTLSIMFSDVSVETAIIQAQAQSQKPIVRGEMALKYQEHLQMALTEGDYYAVPTHSENGDTTYLLCQIVSVKPDAKRYIQRVLGWNESEHWVDQVGVLVVGSRVIHSPDLDGDSPGAMPPDSMFEVHLAGDVEGLPMDAFFKFDFDHIYRFTETEYISRLSTDTIASSLEDDGSGDVFDVTTMCSVGNQISRYQ